MLSPAFFAETYVEKALAIVPSPAGWQSGYAAACKAVYTGSIPVPASISPFSNIR